MGLTVVSGPPRSGREELILDRFGDAAEAGGMLVVPTRDDVDRIERELARRGGTALLGGSVTTLPGLFGEVARAVGAGAAPVATRMQRVWLARAAAERASLRLLARSSARPGFAPALEKLIADLQAAGHDARSLRAAVAELEDGAYEREVCALFAAYEELRGRAGLTDDAEVAGAATAALRADPRSWKGRPVLLLGFDDLSRRQVELVAALAGAAEVAVAITFESDRPSLAARAALRGTLVDELGATVEPPLPRRPARSGAEALHHLERTIFEPDPPATEPDGSIRLLEGAGDRNEAELVARRIAVLLAEGVEPDDIAVAVRSPDRQAPLIARVLAGLGIPVAPEARVPLTATATGAAVLRLLAIAGEEGSAQDVVAFLRGPARATPRAVDWLERRVLRERLATAAEALGSWRGEGDRRIWALDDLAEAGDDPVAAARTIARLAADVAERPHLRSGFVPSSGPAVELRAAAEIRRALEEASALGALAPRPWQIAELLDHVRVPLWTGSAEGRVRILSPYRLRATRLRHLFVAGMSDGSFPARVPADPLLGDDRRGPLGLTPRTDQAAEERFLFYSCVSLPDECLHLSYPASDETGTPTPRSPFVDEVRSLLAPPPTPDAADDEVEGAIATRSGSGPEAVVPAPAEATTPRDLARALAARGGGAEPLAGLALPSGLAAEVEAALAAAADSLAAASAPGPLTHPDVLAELAADRPYGASTLEEYDTCPYRWFVSHELDPRPLGPDPEPLEDGGLVHEVLERLYKSPPAETPRPVPENAERWADAARRLIREAAAERGWRLDSARARIRIARFDAVIARFVRRDAETGGPLEPDPELLEASFGRDPGDRFGAVDLGGFQLHGRIDRIDVSPGGQALIRDYKLSSKAIAAKKLLAEGKLQMPLYLLAVREFGLDPIGGLYSPLGASKEDRPRGLLDKDHKGTLLPDETAAAVRSDFLEREEFEEILEGARERAREIVAGMRTGAVTRSPRDDECPSWCRMAPICRIERGAAVEDPEAEEEVAT